MNHVAIHEVGHALAAHVLRCTYRSIELRNDGKVGAVTRMRHSPECNGAICRIAGAIAERLADPNSDLRGSAQDFADLRRDGITISEEQILKATTILGHGRKTIDALAFALERDRVLTFEQARKIVEKHIGEISSVTKHDRAAVARMDLSELQPAIVIPPGGCACDVKTGKAGSCECNDAADLTFDEAKQSMVVRFGPGGVEAQQRFIAKCLAAKNAARHAAKKDDSMTDSEDDDDECTCPEDDPDCEECADDEDEDEDLNLDRADSADPEPLLSAATKRLQERTANAYRNPPVKKVTE